jgi:formiminotetrahydrofolate cyclodeaminase
MSSDLTTAIALARAGLEGALANVAINLDTLEKESTEEGGFVAQARRQAEALKAAQ